MTSDTPKAPATRGRKPQDHQQKAGTAAEELEARAEREALLEGLPALTPPNELRFRQRARIKEIVAEAVGRDVLREGDDGIEFDITSDADRARLSALYDIVDMIDQFAQSIALDPDAYVGWAKDKEESHFFAILTQYNEAVGESTGS